MKNRPYNERKNAPRREIPPREKNCNLLTSVDITPRFDPSELYEDSSLTGNLGDGNVNRCQQITAIFYTVNTPWCIGQHTLVHRPEMLGASP
jgi:hypothetical protein